MDPSVTNPRTWSIGMIATSAVASMVLLPVAVPVAFFLFILLSPILALVSFAWIILKLVQRGIGEPAGRPIVASRQTLVTGDLQPGENSDQSKNGGWTPAPEPVKSASVQLPAPLAVQVSNPYELLEGTTAESASLAAKQGEALARKESLETNGEAGGSFINWANKLTRKMSGLVAFRSANSSLNKPDE